MGWVMCMQQNNQIREKLSPHLHRKLKEQNITDSLDILLWPLESPSHCSASVCLNTLFCQLYRFYEGHQ